MAANDLPGVLAFDVFGTVVDWRSSISAESGSFLAQIGRSEIDPAAFTDNWRRRYLTGMAAYAKSGRDFTILDVLHREMLEERLRDEGIDPATLDAALLQDWTFAWRRLAPWPDSVEGLTRLKRRFPIVTLSNGNIALMLEMARRGGLPWDAIMGAEVTRAYKPDSRAYLGTAEVLGLAPGEICLVAAHHSDLAAARASGLKTAFIARPMEYGGRPAPDAKLAQDWEWSADSLIDLADQLGC
ncbi:haloacid dehalogenase type II [Sphingomonas sp. IC4-52]|uniref:haloacid dehalogenase type II n=1 Tax=Sphingomonas sp. IC4-52 TaxID=2887202 RepID=UPI001D12A00C|nr:haloacid dehalogenase type II [Sphingomonas sp. IC4-52]MCC2981178.1 haloacid dehalogenase type II [Sphingomonas sp. IC4-52]